MPEAWRRGWTRYCRLAQVAVWSRPSVGIALPLIGLLSSLLTALPSHAQAPWRLGEPEVVWRDLNAFDPRNFSIGTLIVHPRGGFLLVSQSAVRGVRVQRFSSDWRALWSTHVSWGGEDPRYGDQFINVAILPSGHIVLSLTEALALLEPNGRLTWQRGAGRGQAEAFADFQAFGPVVPSGDGFVVGGYGSSAVRYDPDCWSLQGVLARIGIDGRVRWRTVYRLPRPPGGSPSGGTPFAAAPLLARADGSAIGYAAHGRLGTDLGSVSTFAHELQGLSCRGDSPGAFIEVDRRGRTLVRPELRPALAMLRRRHSDLPLYAVIDQAPGTPFGDRLDVYDSELLWLGPHDQALHDLVMTLLPTAALRRSGVSPRAVPRVVTIPAVAAATAGSDVLVLVRRPAGDPSDGETVPRRDGAFRMFLIVVGANGPTIADEREMPPLRSVRLLPEQGIGYGLTPSAVVRFPLRPPAP